MRLLLILLLLNIISSISANAKSLEEILKSSAFISCKNNALISSEFPEVISLLVHQNYLLFVDNLVNSRINQEQIPKNFYKNTIIIKVLYGDIFAGYGGMVSRLKKGYNPNTNIYNLEIFNRLSWWHDEFTGSSISEFLKSELKINEYRMSKPFKIENEKYIFNLINVDNGVGYSFNEKFTCRMPSDKWIKSYFRMID